MAVEAGLPSPPPLPARPRPVFGEIALIPTRQGARRRLPRSRVPAPALTPDFRRLLERQPRTQGHHHPYLRGAPGCATGCGGIGIGVARSGPCLSRLAQVSPMRTRKVGALDPRGPACCGAARPGPRGRLARRLAGLVTPRRPCPAVDRTGAPPALRPESRQDNGVSPRSRSPGPAVLRGGATPRGPNHAGTLRAPVRRSHLAQSSSGGRGAGGGIAITDIDFRGTAREFPAPSHVHHRGPERDAGLAALAIRRFRTAASRETQLLAAAGGYPDPKRRFSGSAPTPRRTDASFTDEVSDAAFRTELACQGPGAT